MTVSDAHEPGLGAASGHHLPAQPLELIVDDQRWPLRPGTVLSVGRDASCDVRVDHPQVSRVHARVEFDEQEGWLLRDAQSMNGLYLEGRRVVGVTLAPETTVGLGGAEDAPVLRVSARGGSLPREGTMPAPGSTPGADDSIVVASYLADGPTPAVVTIGRAADNVLVVDDLLVSRHHARAAPMEDGFLIEDLQSLNGTYVNGAAITSARMRPGDRLTVGHLVFHLDQGELRMVEVSTRISFVAEGLRVVLPTGKVLLAGVDFQLPEASLLAVIGPSGAGKSTLLGALTGSRKATSGQVLFDGRDLYDNYAELRHRIGVVPQDDLVHRQLTVRQALGYASELRFPADLDKRSRTQRIGEVAAELELSAHLDTRIDRLSGGQRKRTSVALELLTRPSLLFLDEPTSGLDPGLDKSVMETLRSLADSGRTVIVVTHSVANLGLADRVLLLAPGGSTAFFGTPEQVLPFFGQEDYSEVFRRVTADPEGVAAAFRDRTRSASPQAPANTADTTSEPAAAPLRQQPRYRQAWTLLRRHLAVMMADHSYALFSAVLPVVMAGLVMTVPGHAGFGPAAVPPTDEPASLLVVMIVGATFMGLAASSRDLVTERPIYQRERAVGLSPTAYLAAKVAAFSGLAVVQSVVVVGLVVLVKQRPDGASVLSNGVAELFIAVAATAICSAMLGLLISASVSTTEQVMPLLVVSLMGQLVLCGGMIPVADRWGLEQLAWIAPSRWGFGAAAATVDLPTKFPKISDPLWNQTSHNWWLCLAMLAVLTGVFIAITAAQLARRARR